MKNIFYVILILIAITAVSNAMTVLGGGVSVTGDELDLKFDLWTGYRLDGSAVNLINGAGFNFDKGIHATDGHVRGHFDWVDDDDNGATPPVVLSTDTEVYNGNMWVAPLDVDPDTVGIQSPTLVFNLDNSDPNIAGIKIWNANSAPSQLQRDYEGSVEITRLGMCVNTMDITVYSAADAVLATLDDVAIPQGPGRDDIDFGEMITFDPVIEDANCVVFTDFTNYGDAPYNQVGLSEVRFYTDFPDVVADAKVVADGNVISIDDDTDDVILWLADANEITMDGSVNVADPNWTYWTVVGYGADANVVIADANLPDTTVKFYNAGTYQFTFGAADDYQDIVSAAEDYDTLYVKVIDAAEEPNGLIANYKFDDGTGTTAVDEVGGLLDLTVADSWSTDTPFASGGSYLSTATADVGFATTAATWGNDEYMLENTLSVSLWIKTTASPYLSEFVADPGAFGFGQKGGRLYVELRRPPYQGPYYYTFSGQTIINDGEWHFVAMTYDWLNGECKAYVDGRLDGQLSLLSSGNGTRMIAVGTSGNGVQLGCVKSTNFQYDYTGLMDDLKVYQVSLSEADIRAAYEEAYPYPANNPCASLDILFTDLTGDCQVDLDDLLELAANWLN